MAKGQPHSPKRLLRRMIDCLYYTADGIKTFYYLDAVKVEKNQSINNKKAGDQNSSAFSNNKKNRYYPNEQPPSNQGVKSASDFAVGALDRTRTCNPSVRSRIFYPIELRVHILKIKNRVN